MEQALGNSLKRGLLDARLPTPPAIAIQLIGLGQSAHADIAQLVAIVRQDPALTALLLRVANSAAYRRVQPADTLSLAASYLGFEPSRMIALSATFVPALAGTRPPGLCHQRYWQRAMLAAACARAIARSHRPNDAEAISLAALIQDIGMLALAQLPDAVYETLDCDAGLHPQAIDLERRAFGTDHGTVGAWLLAHWGLPGRLVEAVAVSNDLERCHAEQGQQGFNSAVLAAGLLADIWTWSGDPQGVGALQAQVCRLLDADMPMLIEIMNQATEELPIIEALCAVQVPDSTAIQEALAALSDRPPAAREQTG